MHTYNPLIGYYPFFLLWLFTYFVTYGFKGWYNIVNTFLIIIIQNVKDLLNKYLR